ncbi:putative thiamine-monophosphate kinase [gamma proteobacterium NOR5-3]|nr:putative thiamine-monophosphate kinase [gamma proteobacterium NOR5-3]
MIQFAVAPDNRDLVTVGERFIKARIMDRIRSSVDKGSGLVGGLGHDAGVLRESLLPNERLLVNTDRSGVSKAYTLGLAGGECIGDFAVSHAVSDILATGGIPFAVSVAMLLPGSTSVKLVDEIVDGIVEACAEFDVTITGGDTKKAEKLSLVVTALGRASEDRLLFRDTPKVGDQLVVSGFLGSMLMGSIIHKRHHKVSELIQKLVDEALVRQRPPYRLAMEMGAARIATACTDISDGLPSACRNMVEKSNLGVELFADNIPIHPALESLLKTLSLTPLQLSMAGGDWQFLYCMPKASIASLNRISDSCGTPLTVVGEVTGASGVWTRSKCGRRRKVRAIEHDSFAVPAEGKSYFEFLSDPQELFE